MTDNQKQRPSYRHAEAPTYRAGQLIVQKREPKFPFRGAVELIHRIVDLAEPNEPSPFARSRYAYQIRNPATGELWNVAECYVLDGVADGDFTVEG